MGPVQLDPWFSCVFFTPFSFTKMASVVVEVQGGVVLAGLPGGQVHRLVTPADIADFASLSPPRSSDRALQASHALFETVFLRALGMAPRDAEVLLVEELEAGPVLRNALRQALVDILRVRAVATVPHAIAAAASTGTWTALVVHVGELGTRIVPVVDGFVVEPAVQGAGCPQITPHSLLRTRFLSRPPLQRSLLVPQPPVASSPAASRPSSSVL